MAVSPDVAIQGPPSEGDFIRALRDHAFATAPLTSIGSVVGLTLSEIEEHSGLSRPSVVGLIKRFDRILSGQDHDARGPGEPERARRWTINPGEGIVIAIEIAQEARVAVSDLYGRIMGSESIAVASVNADETIEQAVTQINRLLNGRPSNDVVGIGVSFAAPVVRNKGVRRASLPRGDSADLWADWELIRMREHLKARLGWDDVPVFVDNDANLSALAEHVWGAGRPSRLGDRPPYHDVIYLEWSKGIGAGIILGGELYRGRGIAGEIGHTVVRPGEPDELLCSCGHAGCLERVAGWETILREINGFSSRERLRRKDFREAVDLAANPDGPARAAFAGAAEYVGQVLGPAIHFLNPQLVIIGGDVGRDAYGAVRTALLQSLKRYTLRPALADVAIVSAHLRDLAVLQGATALVLRPSLGETDALLSFLQRKAGRRSVID